MLCSCSTDVATTPTNTDTTAPSTTVNVQTTAPNATRTPSTDGTPTSSTPTETPDITATPTAKPSPTHTVIYESTTKFGGYIKGEAVQTLTEDETTTEIEAVAYEGYRFVSWSDGLKNPVRVGDQILYDKTLYATFILDMPEYVAPIINIVTEDKEPVLTKENYTTAVIAVTDTKNGKHDGTFTARIKGRGNSSWSSSAPQDSYNSKNSYRLKLDESQKFLGIGDSKNKDWVLNSCKFDASLLRNHIGYRMGEILSGIDYSPECLWAHVYINGDYRGVYMVSEFIEVAKDRVEIDENVPSPDNGFLLELDMRGNLDGELGVDYFYVDGYAEGISNPREWVIKSDLSTDPEIAAQQYEFIKNYVQNVHNAITNGTREEIESLVDMDSFVDMFICSEFSKDVDVNTASFFMYKPSGGKLHLTAPWDYDFGFGTYGVATSMSGLVTSTESANQWFASLIQQKWFVQLVLDRMNEVEDDIIKLTDEITGLGYSLTETANENASKWDLYANHYHSYVSWDVSSYLSDYEMHVQYLNNWMNWRWKLIIYELEAYLSNDSN